MDAVDLVTIENRALAAGNPRIIPPVRIEILGKIAAEDVPELVHEVRRCWQRIAELETQVEQMESAAMDRAIEREKGPGE